MKLLLVEDDAMMHAALERTLGRRGFLIQCASDGVTALDAPAPLAPGAGQWFLERQGIPSAWAVSRGAGVNRAVFSYSLFPHPDPLSANTPAPYPHHDSNSDRFG